MPGKRKLFIMHAGELANRLVHALKHHGMVAEFVRLYAQRFHRPKLIADPERMRELEATIGREALLSVAVEVRRLVPSAFADGNRNPTIEHLAFAEAFFTEFVASLGRALDWSLTDVPAEQQALQRDLEMYWRWRQRSASALPARRSVAGDSPFPDRCALLLDPPMMDQARQAAVEFERQVVRMGARLLDQLGRYSTDRISSQVSHRASSRSADRKSRTSRRAAKPPSSTRNKKTKFALRPKRAPHSPAVKPHAVKLPKSSKRRALKPKRVRAKPTSSFTQAARRVTAGRLTKKSKRLSRAGHQNRSANKKSLPQRIKARNSAKLRANSKKISPGL